MMTIRTGANDDTQEHDEDNESRDSHTETDDDNIDDNGNKREADLEVRRVGVSVVDTDRDLEHLHRLKDRLHNAARQSLDVRNDNGEGNEGVGRGGGHTSQH